MRSTAQGVSEFASASVEQLAGIEQINRAIIQLEQATQQNAALVEQTAAASHSLDEQADSLQSMLDRFVRENRLDG